jgi:triphosphatase
MATEIELKYLVLSDAPEQIITELLNREHIAYQFAEKQLSNCYFDTEDLNLRQHDMGLRTRTVDTQTEQTIKTSGQVVGGLHKRPEYNINIDNDYPILSLFPNEIWQDNQRVEDIQKNLIALFSTDFYRRTWLITDKNNNIIELAFDRGDIRSNSQAEVICELELELVSGDVSGLFDLASLLFSVLLLRPGIKSKAARGYVLWRESMRIQKTTKQVFMSDGNVKSVHELFTQGIGRGLTELQLNIDCYLTSPSLALLANIKLSLAQIRHGFWLFQPALAPSLLGIRNELSHFIHLLSWVDNAIYLSELTNKTGNYRKKLEYSQQLITQLKIEKRRFPDENDICELLHTQRFNQLQLELLKLYLSQEAGTVEAEEHTAELVKYSQDKITASLVDVSQKMKSSITLTSEQYIALSKTLHRSLLTGTWLGGLYEGELRDKFRRPWLDLQQGISELQTLWIISQQLKKLEQPPEKLMQWQKSKVDSLLVALDNSKHMALNMTPYWQI